MMFRGVPVYRDPLVPLHREDPDTGRRIEGLFWIANGTVLVHPDRWDLFVYWVTKLTMYCSTCSALHCESDPCGTVYRLVRYEGKEALVVVERDGKEELQMVPAEMATDVPMSPDEEARVRAIMAESTELPSGGRPK